MVVRHSFFLFCFFCQFLNAGSCQSKRSPEDLYIAAALGNLDFFKQSNLSKKIIVQHCSEGCYQGRTLLSCACEQGNLELASYLLTRGARINDPDAPLFGTKQMSPLLYACNRGFYALVFLLLKNHADVNHVDSDGKSALHYACALGNNNLVDLLLSFKASMTSETFRGETPAFLALVHGHKKLVWHLIEKDLIKEGSLAHISSKNGISPLHRACALELLASVKYLLSVGFSANQKNEFGMVPLHYAAQVKSTEIISYLFRNGADMTLQDNQGKSVLHYACQPWWQGLSFDTVALFIAYGAPLHLRDRFGKESWDYLRQCNTRLLFSDFCSLWYAAGIKNLIQKLEEFKKRIKNEEPFACDALAIFLRRLHQIDERHYRFLRNYNRKGGFRFLAFIQKVFEDRGSILFPAVSRSAKDTRCRVWPCDVLFVGMKSVGPDSSFIARIRYDEPGY